MLHGTAQHWTITTYYSVIQCMYTRAVKTGCKNLGFLGFKKPKNPEKSKF